MEKLTMGLIVMIVLLGGFLSYLAITMDTSDFGLNLTNATDNTTITKINNTRTIISPNQTSTTTNRTTNRTRPGNITNNTNTSSLST